MNMTISEPLPDIRIGTSGYDYPEWEGVFYPKGIGRKEYLRSYSQVFGSLELNFSSVSSLRKRESLSTSRLRRTSHSPTR
jgi:hypothetical protein